MFYANCLTLILGDSFNSSLVAVVAVDPDVMKDWAASQGFKVVDSAKLILALLSPFNPI